MLKVNTQTFAIKIIDGKYFHVYFQFLQTNWRLHNGWAFFCYIFRYIHLTKTEREVVNPSKTKFYKRFVYDIINRINKNKPDALFQKLKSNHPNMKYTVEIKPETFLDTKIVYSNDVITTEVKRNDRKLPVHWSSKVPKRYKRNAIISDLNRATRTASFPADEIPKIKQKFLNADSPYRFIDSVIKNFQEKSDGADDYVIPFRCLLFQRRLY